MRCGGGEGATLRGGAREDAVALGGGDGSSLFGLLDMVDPLLERRNRFSFRSFITKDPRMSFQQIDAMSQSLLFDPPAWLDRCCYCSFLQGLLTDSMGR